MGDIMRWLGVLAVFLVLASVLALAAPMGKPGPVTSKANYPTVDSNLFEVQQKRAMIMGHSASVKGPKVASYGYTVARKRFANMYSVMKKTAEMARKKYQEWYRYRVMYLNGEISEEVYLEKSKELVISIITATVERLNILVEENIADSNVQYLINRLAELNTTVLEINDLNELRRLYREEIRPLIEEAKIYFKEVYTGTSIVLLEGTVNSIDVWVQRVLVWAERTGVDINELQPYIDELNSIKEEIASIKEQYLQGTISLDEALEKIKELRTRIMEIYRSVLELVR